MIGLIYLIGVLLAAPICFKVIAQWMYNESSCELEAFDYSCACFLTFVAMPFWPIILIGLVVLLLFGSFLLPGEHGQKFKPSNFFKK